jgi:hypothetical protein
MSLVESNRPYTLISGTIICAVIKAGTLTEVNNLWAKLLSVALTSGGQMQSGCMSVTADAGDNQARKTREVFL